MRGNCKFKCLLVFLLQNVLVVSSIPVLEPNVYFSKDVESKHDNISSNNLNKILLQESKKKNLEDVYGKACVPCWDSLLKENDVLEFLENLIGAIKEDGAASEGVSKIVENKLKEYSDKHGTTVNESNDKPDDVQLPPISSNLPPEIINVDKELSELVEDENFNIALSLSPYSELDYFSTIDEIDENVTEEALPPSPSDLKELYKPIIEKLKKDSNHNQGVLNDILSTTVDESNVHPATSNLSNTSVPKDNDINKYQSITGKDTMKTNAQVYPDTSNSSNTSVPKDDDTNKSQPIIGNDTMKTDTQVHPGTSNSNTSTPVDGDINKSQSITGKDTLKTITQDHTLLSRNETSNNGTNKENLIENSSPNDLKQSPPNKLSIKITGDDVMNLVGSPSIDNDKLSLSISGIDNFSIIPSSDVPNLNNLENISGNLSKNDDGNVDKKTNELKSSSHSSISTKDIDYDKRVTTVRTDITKVKKPKKQTTDSNNNLDDRNNSKLTDHPNQLSIEVTGSDNLSVTGTQRLDNDKLSLSITGIDNFNIISSPYNDNRIDKHSNEELNTSTHSESYANNTPLDNNFIPANVASIQPPGNTPQNLQTTTPQNVQPTTPLNLQPTTPQNFQPITPQNLQPITPQNLQPITPQNLQPTAPQNLQHITPQNLQPTTLQNLQPITPLNLQPTTPQNFQPITPQNLQPTTPQNLQPITPQNLQPTTPQNLQPITPQNLQPTTLQNLQPITPHNLQPTTLQNLQPITPQNLQPTTPQNFQPITPQNLQPTTPQNLQPTTLQNLQPITPLNLQPTTPQNFQPITPQNLQPTTPQNFQPITPQNLQPTAPQNLQPITPQNLQPTAPQNLQPITPQNLQPTTLQNVQPITPHNLQPTTPQNFQPITPQNLQPTKKIDDKIFEIVGTDSTTTTVLSSPDDDKKLSILVSGVNKFSVLKQDGSETQSVRQMTYENENVEPKNSVTPNQDYQSTNDNALQPAVNEPQSQLSVEFIGIDKLSVTGSEIDDGKLSVSVGNVERFNVRPSSPLPSSDSPLSPPKSVPHSPSSSMSSPTLPSKKTPSKQQPENYGKDTTNLQSPEQLTGVDSTTNSNDTTSGSSRFKNTVEDSDEIYEKRVIETFVITKKKHKSKDSSEFHDVSSSEEENNDTPYGDNLGKIDKQKPPRNFERTKLHDDKNIPNKTIGSPNTKLPNKNIHSRPTKSKLDNNVTKRKDNKQPTGGSEFDEVHSPINVDGSLSSNSDNDDFKSSGDRRSKKDKDYYKTTHTTETETTRKKKSKESSKSHHSSSSTSSSSEEDRVAPHPAKPYGDKNKSYGDNLGENVGNVGKGKDLHSPKPDSKTHDKNTTAPNSKPSNHHPRTDSTLDNVTKSKGKIFSPGSQEFNEVDTIGRKDESLSSSSDDDDYSSDKKRSKKDKDYHMTTHTETETIRRKKLKNKNSSESDDSSSSSSEEEGDIGIHRQTPYGDRKKPPSDNLKPVDYKKQPRNVGRSKLKDGRNVSKEKDLHFVRSNTKVPDRNNNQQSTESPLDNVTKSKGEKLPPGSRAPNEVDAIGRRDESLSSSSDDDDYSSDKKRSKKDKDYHITTHTETETIRRKKHKSKNSSESDDSSSSSSSEEDIGTHHQIPYGDRNKPPSDNLEQVDDKKQPRNVSRNELKDGKNVSKEKDSRSSLSDSKSPSKNSHSKPTGSPLENVNKSKQPKDKELPPGSPGLNEVDAFGSRDESLSSSSDDDDYSSDKKRSKKDKDYHITTHTETETIRRKKHKRSDSSESDDSSSSSEEEDNIRRDQQTPNRNRNKPPSDNLERADDINKPRNVMQNKLKDGKNVSKENDSRSSLSETKSFGKINREPTGSALENVNKSKQPKDKDLPKQGSEFSDDIGRSRNESFSSSSDNELSDSTNKRRSKKDKDYYTTTVTETETSRRKKRKSKGSSESDDLSSSEENDIPHHQKPYGDKNKPFGDNLTAVDDKKRPRNDVPNKLKDSEDVSNDKNSRFTSSHSKPPYRNLNHRPTGSTLGDVTKSKNEQLPPRSTQLNEVDTFIRKDESLSSSSDDDDDYSSDKKRSKKDKDYHITTHTETETIRRKKHKNKNSLESDDSSSSEEEEDVIRTNRQTPYGDRNKPPTNNLKRVDNQKGPRNFVPRKLKDGSKYIPKDKNLLSSSVKQPPIKNIDRQQNESGIDNVNRSMRKPPIVSPLDSFDRQAGEEIDNVTDITKTNVTDISRPNNNGVSVELSGIDNIDIKRSPIDNKLALSIRGIDGYHVVPPSPPPFPTMPVTNPSDHDVLDTNQELGVNGTPNEQNKVNGTTGFPFTTSSSNENKEVDFSSVEKKDVKSQISSEEYEEYEDSGEDYYTTITETEITKLKKKPKSRKDQSKPDVFNSETSDKVDTIKPVLTLPALSIVGIDNLNIPGSVVANNKGISFNIVGPNTKGSFVPDDNDKLSLEITGVDKIGIVTAPENDTNDNSNGLSISGIDNLDLSKILPIVESIKNLDSDGDNNVGKIGDSGSTINGVSPEDKSPNSDKSKSESGRITEGGEKEKVSEEDDDDYTVTRTITEETIRRKKARRKSRHSQGEEEEEEPESIPEIDGDKPLEKPSEPIKIPVPELPGNSVEVTPKDNIEEKPVKDVHDGELNDSKKDHNDVDDESGDDDDDEYEDEDDDDEYSIIKTTEIITKKKGKKKPKKNLNDGNSSEPPNLDVDIPPKPETTSGLDYPLSTPSLSDKLSDNANNTVVVDNNLPQGNHDNDKSSGLSHSPGGDKPSNSKDFGTVSPETNKTQGNSRDDIGPTNSTRKPEIAPTNSTRKPEIADVNEVKQLKPVINGVLSGKDRNESNAEDDSRDSSDSESSSKSESNSSYEETDESYDVVTTTVSIIKKKKDKKPKVTKDLKPVTSLSVQPKVAHKPTVSHPVKKPALPHHHHGRHPQLYNNGWPYYPFAYNNGPMYNPKKTPQILNQPRPTVSPRLTNRYGR